jgi:exopolysaccharide production protein ExoQ
MPRMFAPQAIGFFFAARICITLLGFQTTPTAGTAVYIGGSFLCLFYAWMVAPTASMPIRISHLRWIVAYLALIVISLLWSATKSPMIAFTYWAGIAADCASIYLLMRDDDAIATSQVAMRGFVVGAALVGLIAWTLPTLSDLRIGNEDFLHPNALGYTLGIATLLALQLARHSRWMTIMAIFCGATLFRTISKASIAAFLAAGMFYILRDAHLSRKSKIAIGVAVALAIVLSWGFVEAYVDIYSQGSQAETLTGRTFIWEFAWEEAIKTPWVGHGFYSLRYVIPSVGDFEPWHAHNELLQQFFCYGAVGVVAFIGLYASFIRTVRQYRQSVFATLAGALMVFAVVRGLVDTERFDVNFPLWLMTLFAMALPFSSRSSVE